MKTNKAFSLIELSIVILIIGILVAGVTQASRMVFEMKLSSARSLTKSSPVSSISDLVFWLETSSEESFDDAEEDDTDRITNWYDINPQQLTKINFTQPTPDNRPTYVKNGINGIPSVKFTPTSPNGNVLNASNISLSSGNYSFFIVFNAAVEPGRNNNLFGIYLDSNNSFVDNNAIGTSTITFSISPSIHTSPATFRATHATTNPASSDSNFGTGNAIKPNISYIASFVRNAEITSPSSRSNLAWINSKQIIGNGVTSSPATPTAAQNSVDSGLMSASLGDSLDRTLLGQSDRFLVGNISEVILFDRALKQKEVDDIRDYLSKKYGLK